MRALVSVYDKTGLVAFVRRLVASGVDIVSSGGTADTLESEGIGVTRVDEVTGYPAMLGGRVKTLHPAIHGGILARGPEDDTDLANNGIERFDLVVCNLYPFRETVASGASDTEIIEKIDIGGPTMVRAAAKNHRHVAVVTSPAQYDEVAAAVESGSVDDALRRRLAAEAFFHTASYDAAIVGWIGDDRVIPLRHFAGLRYGENPHQGASIYVEDGASPWWAQAVFHQGKEMSFNNYADAEAAWRLANDLPESSVVIVKHTNACGVGVGESVGESFELAWEGDPLAAFGGVIAIKGVLDAGTAEKIASRFVEVVVCGEVTREAEEVLAPKTGLRVLSAPAPDQDEDMRRVESGLLIQGRDRSGTGEWRIVSRKQPTVAQLDALRLAWTVAAHTKSNAVVIANTDHAVGIGAGDQSRVGAAERAVRKAGERARGAVAASDAFFPFRDGLDTLVAAGVTAVAEPGGSRNDQELIDAADEQGVVLVFTGERHFKH